ncbi:MAG: PorT family protein [Bacteroidales bacterium]|nr:PorT family protein [Bacteroidales bacterium]
MLNYVSHTKKNFRGNLRTFLMMILAVTFGIEVNAQNFADNLNFGLRAGLNMTTISGITESGLELGLTAGVGSKYNIPGNSSLSAELLYTTGGMSADITVETTDTKIKTYDKLHLHYIAIPVVYQYYFNDILGLEIGPQIGFCLGGKEKHKVGNESWVSSKLSPADYNVFDCGILAGIYTNNISQGNDFLVSLRVYFGLTDAMKYEGSNKNICIQFGIGYIIGK